MVVDRIGVVLWRTFVSTLFATLLRNQKNYRDTIVPVGSSASVLSPVAIKSYNKCYQEIAFRPVSNRQLVSLALSWYEEWLPRAVLGIEHTF